MAWAWGSGYLLCCFLQFQGSLSADPMTEKFRSFWSSNSFPCTPWRHYRGVIISGISRKDRGSAHLVFRGSFDIWFIYFFTWYCFYIDFSPLNSCDIKVYWWCLYLWLFPIGVEVQAQSCLFPPAGKPPPGLSQVSPSCFVTFSCMGGLSRKSLDRKVGWNRLIWFVDASLPACHLMESLVFSRHAAVSTLWFPC